MSPLRKLPQQLSGTEILLEIEKKDRRFRIAQAIFFVLIGAMLTAILLSSYNQGTQTKKIIQGQQKTLASLSKNSQENAAQIDKLQNHIDCIVALFQRPNRAQLTITDLSQCTLSEVSNSSSTSPAPVQTPRPVAVAPKSNAQPNAAPAPQTATTTPPPSVSPAKPAHPLVCKVTLHVLGC